MTQMYCIIGPGSHGTSQTIAPHILAAYRARRGRLAAVEFPRAGAAC